MFPIRKKTIDTCQNKELNELILCPFYSWKNHPQHCIWKSISDECLNRNAKKYWNRKIEESIDYII